MTVILIIFTAIIAFLIGFSVGVKKEPPIKVRKFVAKPDKDLQEIKTQYQNFLNYDGSVQR